MAVVVSFGEIMARISTEGYYTLRQSLPGNVTLCFAGAEGGFELHPVRAAAWACCGTGRRCRRGVFPRRLRQGRGGSLEEVTPRSTYPPDTDF